jgi:hypothetical protein
VQHRATRNAVAAAPCRWLNQSPVMRDVHGSDLMATLDEKPPEKVRTTPTSTFLLLPCPILLYPSFLLCPLSVLFFLSCKLYSLSCPSPFLMSRFPIPPFTAFYCLPFLTPYFFLFALLLLLSHTCSTHSNAHDGVQVVKLATEIMALNMVLNLLALLKGKNTGTKVHTLTQKALLDRVARADKDSQEGTQHPR